jgi:hypothetical protein
MLALAAAIFVTAQIYAQQPSVPPTDAEAYLDGQ